MTRLLTCIGDANSIHTHGGLPYFLLEASQRAGFIDAGLSLRPAEFWGRRIGWNLLRLLTAGERGGYQYTDDFLDRLVAQAPAEALSAEIISIFPLFPPLPYWQGPVSFYIDATLRQSISEYAMGGKPAVGPKAFEAAVARERQQYSNAAHVVCRSRWAARAAVEEYNVDPRKVHVVPGGANLPDIDARLVKPRARALKPVRLGFIGKDWKRKNLGFVLDVAEVLDSRGVDVEVVAAGYHPARGPRHRLLRPIGFLNKQNDIGRFVDVVTGFHFGCLFSLVEAFGISNVECMRLGVPVLAWDVGGIRDTVADGLGHLFSRGVGPEDVADVVQAHVKIPEAYWALRERVMERRREATWDRTVAKLIAIWSGAYEHSYAALTSSQLSMQTSG